jgi:hypothetical protein
MGLHMGLRMGLRVLAGMLCVLAGGRADGMWAGGHASARAAALRFCGFVGCPSVRPSFLRASLCASLLHPCVRRFCMHSHAHTTRVRLWSGQRGVRLRLCDVARELRHDVASRVGSGMT